MLKLLVSFKQLFWLVLYSWYILSCAVFVTFIENLLA